MDPLRPSPGRAIDAQLTRRPSPAAPLAAPGLQDASRQLIHSFEEQLALSGAPPQEGTVDAAADPALLGFDISGSEESDETDATGDEFGLDAIAGMDLMATLLPALRASGASATEALRIAHIAAGAAGQAGAGADLLGADAFGSFDNSQPLASLGATQSSYAATPSRGAEHNAAIVAQAARRNGVDPEVAVAMMLVESGGNERAVGDNGTSFGLFQLHEGGMLTSAGLSPTQAFDAGTNADVAMRSLAATARAHPHLDAGALAAASQRPADPVAYAAKVRGALAQARSLLA